MEKSKYKGNTVWCYIDGRSKDRLYKIYERIKNCTINSNHPQYKDYGNRNIKMCDEWLNDYQAFKKWAYESGYKDNAPKGKYTIDRINNNGNYEPNNCRWISYKEQARNRRTTILLEYNNKKQCAKDWSEELKIPYPTFIYKIKRGYTISQIVESRKER